MAQQWHGDGTSIAMAQRWRAMAQRWNSDSDGSDSDGSDIDSDGSDSDSDGAPIERWRSDGQRCDESNSDCQRCDGQASATTAMGDIALRRDGDELSASMAMVHGERW
ncbi:hypothetical protein CBR_g3806 [Chara braunii]|uniref:Uncharacterized protein n=1 Tax=Chara braunii TaxID=69332 RepID=A0A388KGG9_CHABU|nr:hypothetical protein CBR_g3806 [Chara braunii]|eukprot:GBG69108.1 hypothetical protein CBR_g3806 [Chara braunii]